MATVSIKCPACGGPLAWDASKKKFFCEYCRSAYTEEELAKINPETAEAKAVSLEEAQATHKVNAEGKDKTAKIKVYNCPSCGANIAADETMAASVCYYCHNPIVLSDRLDGDFQPDKVIPFAVDKKKASQIFESWIKQHKYLPREFYSKDEVDKLQGVYFPYWVYNCKIDSKASGFGYVDKVWTDSQFQYTDTTKYAIDREGTMPINNVSRIALKKASKALCESVVPFNFEDAIPFNSAYLQGYVAEMRDVDKDSIEPEVTQEVRNYAANQMRLEAGREYNKTEFTSVTADIKDPNWQYILMPVWTITYKDRDSSKVYYFSINGSTGKTVGELPVDKGKLWGLFAKIAVPVFVFLVAIMHFLG
ncbi:MAG: TFIIB-type zinc ribbon-containing protein [Eubacteriales bacterium]|nr:TFIIB-type zinc ribbon-containing protein [Eubacteriales bacterium]